MESMNATKKKYPYLDAYFCIIVVLAFVSSSSSIHVSGAFIQPSVRKPSQLNKMFDCFHHKEKLSKQSSLITNYKSSFNGDWILSYRTNDGDDDLETGMSSSSEKEKLSDAIQPSNLEDPLRGQDTVTQERDTVPSENTDNIGIWDRLLSKMNQNDAKNGEQSSRVPLPIEIQDLNVLYYDIFLILNLSVSISFWVVHRLSLFNIMDAFSEGCLLSILWIMSGLYNGAFLYSAIDGHHDMTRNESYDKGGPKAAGLLGLWTFVGTINLRMVIALIMAVGEHRPVGAAGGEDLIPLELCFGLVLMSMWRMLHSTYSRV